MGPIVKIVYCTWLGATTGLWCRDCATSAGVAAHVAVRLSGGISSVSRTLWCTDCGGDNIVPPEEEP